MGNKLNVELKEGCRLDINEKLIQDFQDRIYMMDKSMASFAYAVDTMETACVNLLRHIHSSSDEDARPRGDDLLGDTTLVESIKECVKDHKFIFLESASKLIHLIIDTGKNYTEVHTELAIDRYNDKHNVTGIPYYDQRLKELQTEVKILRQKYQRERQHVDILNDREELYAKESEKFKMKIAKMKSEREVLRNTLTTNQTKYEDTQIIDIDEQNSKLEEENIELRKMTEDLKSKTHSCLEEINLSIKEIARFSEHTKVTEDLEMTQETLEHSGISCESASLGEKQVSLINDDIKCYEESLNIQMMKIRDQLKIFKTYFESEINSNIREYNALVQSKYQIPQTENEVLLEAPVTTNTCNDDLEKLRLIKDEMKEKEKELTSEVKELKLKLKTLQNRKTVHVQVYYEIGVRKGSKEKDLLNILKIHMDKRCISLQISELRTPWHAQADIPLLVIRIRNYGYKSYFQSSEYWHVLDDFNVTQKMALITLHRKDGTVSKKYIEEKEGVTKDVARSFDIGYDTRWKRFDFNEETIGPIIDFILKASTSPKAEETDV